MKKIGLLVVLLVLFAGATITHKSGGIIKGQIYIKETLVAAETVYYYCPIAMSQLDDGSYSIQWQVDSIRDAMKATLYQSYSMDSVWWHNQTKLDSSVTIDSGTTTGEFKPYPYIRWEMNAFMSAGDTLDMKLWINAVRE